MIEPRLGHSTSNPLPLVAVLLLFVQKFNFEFESDVCSTMNLANNKRYTSISFAATNVVRACSIDAELRYIVCFVGTLCRYKKYPFCSAERNQLLYINKIYIGV